MLTFDLSKGGNVDETARMKQLEQLLAQARPSNQGDTPAPPPPAPAAPAPASVAPAPPAASAH